MTAATNTTAPRLDELIGTADAARRLDVMPWAITNAARRGELRAYKVPGNRLAFRRADVDAWNATRKRADTSASTPRLGSAPDGAP